VGEIGWWAGRGNEDDSEGGGYWEREREREREMERERKMESLGWCVRVEDDG